jgi:hypothetical protein
MCGAVPPLPLYVFIAWCLVKHRDNFTTASRSDLRPTQPPIQWTAGALSAGVKRPRREADHSPSPSAEFKNAWRYKSTPPYVFMAWYLV